MGGNPFDLFHTGFTVEDLPPFVVSAQRLGTCNQRGPLLVSLDNRFPRLFKGLRDFQNLSDIAGYFGNALSLKHSLGDRALDSGRQFCRDVAQ